jgi:hypothetical protein
MNERKRVRAFAGGLAVLALLPASLVASAADGQPVARASGYYEPCGTLSFKGSHKLEHHVVSCAKASRKATYVLKHHGAPAGWKCSLSNLRSGYAACARGQKAFALFPA